MPELTGIALTGLSATKTALATTGHNISNVNTDGYSRQVVTFGTYPPQRHGSGYIGNGVKVTNINRVADQFLTDQLRRSTQTQSELKTYREYASRLDSLLGDEATAITPTLIKFFKAVDEVADRPASVPARQVLLSEAGALANRFNTVYEQLRLQNNFLNNDLEATVSEINKVAATVATLNLRITSKGSSQFSNPPNDLLDSRDEAVRRLSEMIGINVVTEKNGAINISVGSGQPLVIGNDSYQLGTKPDESGVNRNDIVLKTDYHESVITEGVFGGRVGGLLRVRNELVDTVFNEIGRMAMVISDNFNEQHKLGMDLNGQLGSDFFTDINSSEYESMRVSAFKSNTGNANIALHIDDTKKLAIHDYKLRYDAAGAGTYTLIDVEKNTTVTSFAAPAPASLPAEVNIPSEGLTIKFNTGAPADQDTFMLSPTRLGATNMNMELEVPNQIAAALPVRVTLPNTNSGDLNIKEVQVTDTTNVAFTNTAKKLEPNYRVVFTSETQYEIHDYSYTFDSAVKAGAIADGALNINNVNIGPIAVAAGDIDNNLVGKINAKTTATGVSASIVGGKLKLTSTKGENFTVSLAADPDALNGINDNAAALTSGTVAVNAGSLTANNLPSASSLIATGTFTPNAENKLFNNSSLVFTPPATGPLSHGYDLVMSGNPAKNDTLDIRYNQGAVNDNRNMLKLAKLQRAKTMADGSSTYQEAYNRVVGGVGTRTRDARIGEEAAETILRQTKSQRDEVSGVNLDEEAANLIRFQNAYQASAKIIQVSSELFDTIINVIG